MKYVFCVQRRNRAIEASKIVRLDSSIIVGKMTIGQSRLLAIAAELVSNPTLICLDDPLSGLDEINALLVMDVLRRIAHRQHSPTTIVMSVAQHGHCLLRGVNQLVILADSKMTFCRDISALSSHVSRTVASSPGHPGVGADADLRAIEDKIAFALSEVESKISAFEETEVSPAGEWKKGIDKSIAEFCVNLNAKLRDVLGNDYEEGDPVVFSSITAADSQQSSGSNSISGNAVLTPVKSSDRTESGAILNSADRASKSRRQLRQGQGGGFVRAPKKTADEFAALTSRSKQNQINNVSAFVVISSCR
jgi:energy-coupling factor transporter ATP-binding protein EcfA2